MIKRVLIPMLGTLMLVLSLSGLGVSTAPPALAASQQPDHVALITFENQNYPEVIGNSDWPYLNNTVMANCSTAPGCINLTNMTEMQGTTQWNTDLGSTGTGAESSPEYSYALSGYVKDGNSHLVTDINMNKSSGYTVDIPNIYKQIDNGGTQSWLSYQENYALSSGSPDCSTSYSERTGDNYGHANYARRHNTAAFYADITGDCSSDVKDFGNFPTGYRTGSETDGVDKGDNLQPAYQTFTGSDTWANFVNITPNLCHDTHNSNGACPGNLRSDGSTGNQWDFQSSSGCPEAASDTVLASKGLVADYWLCQNLDSIRKDVGSEGVVIITFDEGDENCKNPAFGSCTGGGDYQTDSSGNLTPQRIATVILPGTGAKLFNTLGNDSAAYDQTSVFKALVAAFGGGTGCGFYSGQANTNCTSGDAALPILTVAPVSNAPQINSVTPSAAKQGGTITIKGSNFTGASAVTVAGGLTPTSFTVVSSSKITAVAPNTDGFGVATVTTTNGTGTSGVSTYVDGTNPDTVTGMSHSNVDGNTATLSWNAAGDSGGSGVVSYRLYKCSGSLSCTSNTYSTVTGTSYTDSTLSTSTAYGFATKAVDAAGNVSSSKSSWTYFTTSSGNCPAITSITSSGAVGDTITITGCGFNDAGFNPASVFFSTPETGKSNPDTNMHAYSTTQVNDTTITAVVPYNATTGYIYLHNGTTGTWYTSPTSFTVTGTHLRQTTGNFGEDDADGVSDIQLSAWGVAPTSGDLLVVAVNRDGNGVVTTPTGWTVGKDKSNASTIFYRVADGTSADNTPDISFDRSVDVVAAGADYANAPTTLDKTAGDTSGTSNVSTWVSGTTPTTTAANELVIATGVMIPPSTTGGGQTNPGTYSGGFGNGGVNNVFDNGQFIEGEFRVGFVSATGQYYSDFSTSSSFKSRGAIVTFK